MKTYCKHTRVADPRFVRESIDHYLKGKRSRRDVGAWLDHHPDLDRVAEAIASEIRTGRFHDTTIRYFNRTEPISGKHRVIGCESVHHQILDHVATERLAKLRRRRDGTVVRHRLVTHVLFYMDDILLVGRGKADLRMAARMLSAYLRRFLHLDVHPEWNAKRLALEPIDMVGFTFRPHGRVNIRHGVFLRARRNFRRARRTASIPVWLARRLASYYGYFKWSDSITYRRRNGIDKTMRRARKVLAA